MIGPPPLSIGAFHDTNAERKPGVADTSVGGSGLVRGITGAEGAEVDVRPIEFVTVTVNVYAVPFDRFDMRRDRAPGSEVCVKLPGLDVTVYEMTGSVVAGQATIAVLFPGNATTFVTLIGYEVIS